MKCKLEWGVSGQTLAKRDQVGVAVGGYSLAVTDRRTYKTEGWSFWSDWSGWTDTETESRVGWFNVSNNESQVIRGETTRGKWHKEAQEESHGWTGSPRWGKGERAWKRRTVSGPAWHSRLTTAPCEKNKLWKWNIICDWYFNYRCFFFYSWSKTELLLVQWV